MLCVQKQKQKGGNNKHEVPDMGHTSEIVTYAKNLRLPFKRKRCDMVIPRSDFNGYQSTMRWIVIICVSIATIRACLHIGRCLGIILSKPDATKCTTPERTDQRERYRPSLIDFTIYHGSSLKCIHIYASRIIFPWRRSRLRRRFCIVLLKYPRIVRPALKVQVIAWMRMRGRIRIRVKIQIDKLAFDGGVMDVPRSYKRWI